MVDIQNKNLKPYLSTDQVNTRKSVSIFTYFADMLDPLDMLQSLYYFMKLDTNSDLLKAVCSIQCYLPPMLQQCNQTGCTEGLESVVAVQECNVAATQRHLEAINIYLLSCIAI